MIAALPEARVDATDRGIVEVLYLGRLGNRLTQYCMGRIVATALGFDLWSETIPVSRTCRDSATDASPQSSRFQVVGGHRFDLAGILADRTPRRIVMRGFFHRYEYFRPHKELIREWLASDSGEQSPPDELTIHVRAGDIWKGDRDPRKVHPEYHGLPFSFYDGIVRSRPWSKVKVVTEDRSDPMVGKLVAAYDAEVQSRSKLEDFQRAAGELQSGAVGELLRVVGGLALEGESGSSFRWWVSSIRLARGSDRPRGSRTSGSMMNLATSRFGPPGWPVRGRERRKNASDCSIRSSLPERLRRVLARRRRANPRHFAPCRFRVRSMSMYFHVKPNCDG
jgi:hypothetical protein